MSKHRIAVAFKSILEACRQIQLAFLVASFFIALCEAAAQDQIARPSISILLDASQVVPTGSVKVTYTCNDPDAHSAAEVQFRSRLIPPSYNRGGVRRLETLWSDWMQGPGSSAYGEFSEEGVYEVDAECRNTRTRRELGTIVSHFIVTSQITYLYLPDGQWVVKQAFGNSQSTCRLWVPSLVPEGETSARGRGQRQPPVRTQADVERRVHRTAPPDERHSGRICGGSVQPIVSGLSTGKKALEVVQQAKLSESRSILGREFVGQLGVAIDILEIAGAVSDADVEVLIAYSALQAFQETRYSCLQRLVAQARNVDPEMSAGLNDAYRRITEDQQKKLGELKSAARRGALVKTGGKVLFHMLVETAAGPALQTLLGSAATASGISVALPAVWLWQLTRTLDAANAEASIVLLSTLDRGPLSDNDLMSTQADRYIVEQLRAYASRMSTEAARIYRDKVTASWEAKEKMKMWAYGDPHYDRSLVRARAREAQSSLYVTLFLHRPRN